MIDLQKITCCGCSACAQRCPKQCITMKVDEEGFLYPQVNTEMCIDCGLCEKACPCMNTKEPQSPLKTVVAVNPNAIVRQQSSSGGLFSMFAEQVINDEGVVFGARFNDQWEVVHDCTDSAEDLQSFYGSKYAQSTIGDAYNRVEESLINGRKVLFTGTPCQTAGLHHFLGKDNENLLTVAIACHSVPSPKVWKEYLDGLRLDNIKAINFRDKSISWERYGLKIVRDNGKTFFQEHEKNAFMQLFLHGLTVRPSCFQCPAKNGKSMADIVIGDCWGLDQVAPGVMNDHQGVSIAVCQTEKGVKYMESLQLSLTEVSYSQIVKHNGGLTQTAKEPKERVDFWKDYMDGADKMRVMRWFAKPYIPSLTMRVKMFLYRKLLKK